MEMIIWRYSALLLQLLILQLAAFAEGVPAGDDGEWGEWSSCSRTCGPAISFQERNCSNAECGEGPRMQFRSCQNEPCEEEVDLRRELCATFSNENLTFSPLANKGQCLLTCKATTQDGHMVVQGPLEAPPGTPCTTASGDPGTCIRSLCTPIGCDGLAGSKKAIDKCGRCIGPNVYSEVCSKTSGTRTRDPATGHVEMVVVPAGSSSVSITNNLPPHLASLMVRSEMGDFLFSVGPPGHRFVAGDAEFEYRVSVDGGNFTESLSTNDTLNSSVTIEVYIPSQRIAPSISYEYHSLKYISPWDQAGARSAVLPSVSTANNINWTYGPFLGCTETCTTGIQVAYAWCTDLDFHHRILPDQYCSSEKPSPILRLCGTGNCAPRWVTREWQPCSQTRCGVGSQQRLVQCMVLEANGRDTMVADDLCTSSSRPSHQRECLMRDSSGCNTQWEEDEWGECCSHEPLERRVECVDTYGDPQPPFLCSHLHRNSSLRTCLKGPCTNGGCSWIPKRWFSCNNTCGRGVQRRKVRCRNVANEPAPAYCCREQPLPELQRDCYDDRASWCQPQWHIGTWEQCRGNCGENKGERTREVDCLAENRQDLHVEFPHDFCSNQSQPASSENCTRDDARCRDCRWETTSWSDCYCPASVKIRNVSCSSGVDVCCFRRQPEKPPEAEACDCPTTGQPPATPTEETCVDYSGVNCRQLLEDGLCHKEDTNIFKLLCCQTCSGLR